MWIVIYLLVGILFCFSPYATHIVNPTVVWAIENNKDLMDGFSDDEVKLTKALIYFFVLCFVTIAYPFLILSAIKITF